ncbi:mRNA splicing factor [Cylindrobasidium torrendii FP15055 ss-10]|uniref:mRNA splicing factor n=1 Tax=Cylindrobasidium torrendii FP15055 ss-10 TaxID=1314674 RepID=A0A0D7BRW6_9AGAR|nr:mRNA splicing factor [Cylindrobasidium torrendii FP15055 ss-10]
MTLQEQSEARKERLLALRARKNGTGGDVLKNRNFDPESRTLKKRALGGEENEDTVEKNVEGLAKMIISEDEERRAQDLDIFNIAPKRPNWDLKRRTDEKLAKLERRTQEAIHTLIRQRLAAEKGNSDDLLGAMNAQERAAEAANNSDDEDN